MYRLCLLLKLIVVNTKVNKIVRKSLPITLYSQINKEILKHKCSNYSIWFVYLTQVEAILLALLFPYLIETVFPWKRIEKQLLPLLSHKYWKAVSHKELILEDKLFIFIQIFVYPWNKRSRGFNHRQTLHFAFSKFTQNILMTAEWHCLYLETW